MITPKDILLQKGDADDVSAMFNAIERQNDDKDKRRAMIDKQMEIDPSGLYLVPTTLTLSRNTTITMYVCPFRLPRDLLGRATTSFTSQQI